MRVCLCRLREEFVQNGGRYTIDVMKLSLPNSGCVGILYSEETMILIGVHGRVHGRAAGGSKTGKPRRCRYDRVRVNGHERTLAVKWLSCEKPCMAPL